MENKKTIIAIIIVVILIILLIGVSYLFYDYNQTQLKTLTDESNKILQESIATEEIDMDIKTKRDYATVEKAIKEYVQKLKNIYIQMEELGEQIDPDVIFSGENIEDKNLDKIDTIISEYKEKSKEYLEEYEGLITEEAISENINSQKFSSRREYYISLYNTVMLGDVMKSQYELLENEIEKSKDNLYDKLTIISNMKQFLESNSRYWSIKDKKIIFTNTNIMTEFYNMKNELSD